MAALDAKIDRALDLAIELGDLDAAKERLRALRDERQRTAAELARCSLALPSVAELMPRLRAKLAHVEETLCADVARGRLTLGALFGSRRLRVHRDGRIEGAATIIPDMFATPETPQERGRRGGDPGAIRTRDPQLRRLVLYPG